MWSDTRKWARFFLRYVTHRSDLVVALLGCSAAVAAAELAIPWLLRQAIDTALGEMIGVGLDIWVLWMLAVLAVLYAVHVFMLRIEARMLYEASYDLRRRLYTHFHSQALAFFHRHKSGELMHRVISDTALFEDNAVELFSDLPYELLTVTGVLIMMALMDVRLMGVVILFMLAALVVTGYLGRPLPTLRKSIQGIGAGLAGRLQESLTGIRTVQAFNNESHELNRLDEANRKILQTEVRVGGLEALIVPLFELMEILGVVLVVWYGGHLIIKKQITVGSLVAFMAYMEILAGPASRIGSYYRYFQTCRAVGERLQNLLDDSEILPQSNGKQPTGERWDITLENVSFRYPGSTREVLQGLSFTVKHDESVAVIGRNGAGKSTLMDLLLRFYDPAAGCITAGGLDLKDWDLKAWRRAVGVVSQDVFLFHATIAENIAYSRPEASRKEIEMAARESGAEHLIRRLPNGLDTVVGERGAKLSGGERQLVALARLFLRNPRVLIMDEPTTHLDGEALQLARMALSRLMVGRTTFLVVHGNEMIQLVDRVLLLDRGQLVADGTDGELSSHNALYRKLLQEIGESHAKQCA